MTEIRNALTPPVAAAELSALDPIASVEKSWSSRFKELWQDTRVKIGIGAGVLASAGALMAGVAGAKTPRAEADTIGFEAKVAAVASTDPGVQAFEVVASNDPIQTRGSELIVSLHGVQAYANKNGNGLRVKFRENADGTYNVPIVRIGMTQEALANANETEVFKAVQAVLPDESGVNTLNLGWVKGANFKESCSAIAGSMPDPEKLAIISLQSNCTHPDTSPGYDARSVTAMSTLILASKISWYVRDQSDTLNFGKVPFWDLTYVNHSRKYDNIYSSPFLQRHLPIETSGPGNVGTAPAADSCREDCGSTPLFTQGQPVTITAQPGANGEFRAWQNCPAPEGNVCKVDLGNIANDPMQPIKPITAEFKDKTPPLQERRLKTVLRGHGSVKAAGGIACANTKVKIKTCVFELPSGKRVRLTEVPGKGWKFNGWYGACKGLGRYCLLDMTANQSVGARFKKVS